MATKHWLGTAPAVAQVSQATVTGYDGSTTYKITVGSGTRTVVISAVGTTDATGTAAALATAWNASTHPYCTGITASSSTGTVILTGDVAGVPFTVASSVTGGSGTFGAFSTTTAATGPNDASAAANWSGGTLPSNNDTIILRDSDVNLCWGLDLSSLTGITWLQERTFTGRVGLDYRYFATTSNGETVSQSALEYREDYLKIDATRIVIGEHVGTGTAAGTSRTKIHNTRTSGGSALEVIYTASADDTGKPSVRYLVADSAATVEVRAPSAAYVGVAVDEPGEVSTVASINLSGAAKGAQCLCGSGVTLASWSQSGGAGAMNAAATVTSVLCQGGTLTMEGDYTVTTLTVNGGTVTDNHIKTGGNAVTTAVVSGGSLDLTQSRRARTYASTKVQSGGKLLAEKDVMTFTSFLPPDGLFTLSAA